MQTPSPATVERKVIRDGLQAVWITGATAEVVQAAVDQVMQGDPVPSYACFRGPHGWNGQFWAAGEVIPAPAAVRL